MPWAVANLVGFSAAPWEAGSVYSASPTVLPWPSTTLYFQVTVAISPAATFFGVGVLIMHPTTYTSSPSVAARSVNGVAYWIGTATPPEGRRHTFPSSPGTHEGNGGQSQRGS